MKTLYIIISLLFLTNLQAQDWKEDLNQAKEIATKENKKIILVFSGSDWCAPCIKLEREIFESPEFVDYAKKHYILLKADFPRKKKNQLSKEQQLKNNRLFEQYNPQGFFPFVVVLNSEGEILGTTSYKKLSPKEYIDELNSFNEN